jgi:hypothetical protein
MLENLLDIILIMKVKMRARIAKMRKRKRMLAEPVMRMRMLAEPVMRMRIITLFCF